MYTVNISLKIDTKTSFRVILTKTGFSEKDTKG